MSSKKYLESLEKTRLTEPYIASDLRPLFNHLVTLSLDSHKRGRFTRAGRELRQARNLAKHKETITEPYGYRWVGGKLVKGGP